MKIQLRLSDVDRKRFDAPESLELDPATVSFREVIAMQKGFDVEGELIAFDSANEWRAAWYGRPVLGEDGEPVMVPVVDDEDEPVLDDDGKPKLAERRVGDWGAVLVAVWLALRRAGITRPLAEVADCDPERIGVSVVPDDTDESGPGKGDSGPATIS